MGFQNFECLGHVQDCLSTCRHDRYGGLGKLKQVGRDVKAVFRPFVHAADAARGEDGDACQMGCDHGGCNRGGPGTPGGDARGHVGARQFGNAGGLGKGAKLRIFQTDMQIAVDDGDRCRGGTGCTHIGFDGSRDFKILRIRHAVGDDRAFKGDDGRAGSLGGGDFGRAVQRNHILVSPETYCAAAASAWVRAASGAAP